MGPQNILTISLALLLAACPALAQAASKSRTHAKVPAASSASSAPDAYRWDLTHLYPSDAAWDDAKAALARSVAAFRERHEGRLGASAKALADALVELAGIRKESERLMAYAMARSDEDVRAARPRERRLEAERLGVELDAAASFVRPEVLAIDAAKVRSFLAEEPRLKEFDFFLTDLLRWKEHTLSPREERIVAQAGELAGARALGARRPHERRHPLADGEALDGREDPPGSRRLPARADGGLRGGPREGVPRVLRRGEDLRADARRGAGCAGEGAPLREGRARLRLVARVGALRRRTSRPRSTTSSSPT